MIASRRPTITAVHGRHSIVTDEDRVKALVNLLASSKRRDAPYRSGRSPDWLKVKNPDAPAATRVLICLAALGMIGTTRPALVHQHACPE